MGDSLISKVKPKYIRTVRIFSINYLLVPPAYLYIACILELLCVIYGSTSASELCIGLFAIIIAAIFVPELDLFFTKKNFEATLYKIYPDRIEFAEGAVCQTFITIKMEDIKKIRLSQSIAQKFANVGTIKLNVKNTVYLSFFDYAMGIALRDIENPNAVYAQLKQIKENNLITL